jgi:hypothetical protein
LTTPRHGAPGSVSPITGVIWVIRHGPAALAMNV